MATPQGLYNEAHCGYGLFGPPKRGQFRGPKGQIRPARGGPEALSPSSDRPQTLYSTQFEAKATTCLAVDDGEWV